MEHRVKFSFEGRYFTLGNARSPSQIWFVLHGYGQLASFFIRKFACLEERNILVVAPEGLSKFYLEEPGERMKSGNNRVGASWMTREDRTTDIGNYLAFLDSVGKEVLKTNQIPITVLGFSQGAATATRWVLDGQLNFHRLILWAGILPPDIDLSAGKDILKNKEVILVYGDKDPFLSDSRFVEMTALSEKLEVNPRVVSFKGGHNIDPEILLKLV